MLRNGRLVGDGRSRPARWSRASLLGGAATLCFAFSFLPPAIAEQALATPGMPVGAEIIGFAFGGGLLLVSAVLALTLIGERSRWRRREAEMAAELDEARAKFDRAKTFLASEPQAFVVWSDPTSEPEISAAALILEPGAPPRRLLAFGAWLAPKDAQALDAALDRLRKNGRSLSPVARRFFRALFRRRRAALSAAAPCCESAKSRVTGWSSSSLRERHAESERALEGLRAMLDAAPTPVWLRDVERQTLFRQQRLCGGRRGSGS